MRIVEVGRVTGMVLTVRVVWPEFGDEQLQQLIREHPDDVWRVDEFPNFVTYRRQIEALKTVCVKNYLEPKPTDIVRQILALPAAFGQNISGVDRPRAEETGGGGASGGDQPHQLLPAVDHVQPSPADGNFEAASSDFVLPSDVVTDEAPPDEAEVSSQLPSVAAADRTVTDLQQPLWHPRRKERGYAKFQPSCKDLNESQRLAVDAAVFEPLTVIQGPPGTGKTRTAAEIVKEWLLLDRTSKVITINS